MACAGIVFAQDNEARKLDREYQSAVANYDAGRHAEAVSQLEDLLTHMPNSFDLHELLGLAYASLSQETKRDLASGNGGAIEAGFGGGTD